MNGLKFMRKICNLSICDIAEILSVSRQAVSAWENGKKKIPENRKDELSAFLGIDKKYLEELAPEDEKYLLNQFMYIHFLGNKNIFLFRPNSTELEENQLKIKYNTLPEHSLNEEYEQANKQKQETLKRIDYLISKSPYDYYTFSKTATVTKNCRIYGYLSDIIENILDSDPSQKVKLRYGLENILLAVKLAYGLIKENDLIFDEKDPVYNRKWIIELSEIIKEQLQKEASF